MNDYKYFSHLLIGPDKLVRSIYEGDDLPENCILIDIAKHDRVDRVNTRMPGSSSAGIKAADEYLFVAVDDHARIRYTAMYRDVSAATAAQFLQSAVAHIRCQGAQPSRVVTDRAVPYRSVAFAKVCRQMGLEHHVRPSYDPMIKARIERFFQLTLRTRI